MGIAFLGDEDQIGGAHRVRIAPNVDSYLSADRPSAFRFLAVGTEPHPELELQISMFVPCRHSRHDLSVDQLARLRI